MSTNLAFPHLPRPLLREGLPPRPSAPGPLAFLPPYALGPHCCACPSQGHGARPHQEYLLTRPALLAALTTNMLSDKVGRKNSRAQNNVRHEPPPPASEGEVGPGTGHAALWGQSCELWLPSLSAASCSTSNIQPVARALRTELNWVLGSSLPTASRGQGQARQPLPWLLPEPSHLTEPPSPHPVLSLCTRALMFLLPV